MTWRNILWGKSAKMGGGSRIQLSPFKPEFTKRHKSFPEPNQVEFVPDVFLNLTLLSLCLDLTEPHSSFSKPTHQFLHAHAVCPSKESPAPPTRSSCETIPL